AANAAGPYHNVVAALGQLFERSAQDRGVAPATMQAGYLAFVFVWAGLGEELFYRGYMHAALRRTCGFAPAALLSAACFALRHAAQLAYLAPDYPYGAAVSWVGFSFVAGIVFSWLYEKTGSLRAPVAAHYLLNAIPVVAAAG
ncbi:MAG TPA: CPBP family intramembrane glutamic endopeptidase, partial [Candidatus Polarisedimenticolia bacterium]|nr:CPBP family intramembrane glutamic endopeptidase [Candidatus Polarisedimenticolia bacterium]